MAYVQVITVSQNLNSVFILLDLYDAFGLGVSFT